jgi:hypothetical protein
MSEKKRTSPKNTPEHVIRHGEVTVEISITQSNSGYQYFHYSIGRRFNSMTTGKEAHGSSFFHRHEEDLVQAIREASEWIRTKLQGTLPPKERNADTETR